MTRPSLNSVARRGLGMAMIVIGLASSAFAEGACNGSNRRGASLLIPYFEIDTRRPDGRTTVISIGNGEVDPVLVRVTLWTDWGQPTFAFDAELGPEEVLPINLFQVMVLGNLPSQTLGFEGGSGAVPIIAPPCVLQTLDPEELIAKHTGQPLDDGLCYGSTRAGADLAVGFVTVDVVNHCAGSVIYPRDPGYFEAGGQGLASNRNTLWGDVYLIDPDQDLAQGLEAVPLVADADAFGTSPGQVLRSFYSDSEVAGADQRLPLGLTYRARYLTGGEFSTDFLVWTGWSEIEWVPGDCGTRATSGSSWVNGFEFRSWDEDGELQPQESVDPSGQVHRLTLGGDLPVAAGFGVGELSLDSRRVGIPPGGVSQIQLWVQPLTSARNRFSAGLRAIEVEGYCDDAPE